MAQDAVVVHCAAPGLQYPPLVPIWGPEAITLQPIRTGFPCFGAAIAGYVEAHPRRRRGEEPAVPARRRTRNTTSRLGAACRCSAARASTAFAADPDLKAWADATSLNPARIPPDLVDSAELGAAVQRFRTHVGPGLARMEELSGMS